MRPNPGASFALLRPAPATRYGMFTEFKCHWGQHGGMSSAFCVEDGFWLGYLVVMEVE